MAIEIEKKYRLTIDQRERVITSLRAAGAQFRGEEFETNLIFGGGVLDGQEAVLRIRKTASKNLLTYKRNVSAAEGIKHHIEHETVIADAEAMQQIAEAMEFSITLIYEKRRQTWELAKTSVVIDQLPFGHFMEIEGSVAQIEEVDSILDLGELQVEPRTYPFMTSRLGRKNGLRTEALFAAE